VIVVVEVIITLMMQQMHAYMLPGAAKSLGKHLPQIIVLCSTRLEKILTLTCQLLNVQHIGMEFVSGEITLERLLSLIASRSNKDAQ
jgi:hypothetical protein